MSMRSLQIALFLMVCGLSFGCSDTKAPPPVQTPEEKKSIEDGMRNSAGAKKMGMSGDKKDEKKTP